MRIVLTINDELLIRAKAVSRKEGKSLTVLIEEGLRLRLRKRFPAKVAPEFRLPIYQGKGGLREGVDSRSHRLLCDDAGVKT